jgi:F-type H+-transporting ATPase subunit a
VKRWLTILAVVAVWIIPGVFFRFGAAAVTASVAVKPEVLFQLGGFQITNTLFTSWIVILLIILFVVAATRKMALVPSGWQNVLEAIIEALYGLAQSVAGKRGAKFFPIIATIFLYVLFSNWLGLIPGFGPIGIIAAHEGQQMPQGITTIDLPPALAHFFGAPSGEDETALLLAPFVRSPSTDINMTLALALISVILTQIFGMQALGFFGYWGKFFNVAKFFTFFRALIHGKLQFGLLFYGFIDLFVGILELISEMVKILSFTFRLFGNIFAGEVVLLIMAFLFFALPFPFYGLEIFVGFMQAFVFMILTLVFMTIATTPHGGAAEHH